jgi:hypothetical protein
MSKSDAEALFNRIRVRGRAAGRASIVCAAAASILVFSGCEGPADPSDLIILPPTVSDITAAFDEQAQSTTYTSNIRNNLLFEIEVTASWSGPSCGLWTEQEFLFNIPASRDLGNPQPTAFGWIHPHPQCGNDPAHSDTTIRLIVDWSRGSTACTYRGARSGTGPDCIHTLSE